MTPSPTTANSNINNGSAQPSSSSTSSLALSASSTNGVGSLPVSQVTANGVMAAQLNGSSSTVAPAGVSDTLTIERCFGLLIAPGHKVKHADMNLLEMVSVCRFGWLQTPASWYSAVTRRRHRTDSHWHFLLNNQLEIVAGWLLLVALHSNSPLFEGGLKGHYSWVM